MREGFGFDRFVTQGGDFGALVSTWLGIDHPNHVMGIHVDTVGLRPPTGPGVRPLDAAEQAWLGRVRERRADAMAYANIHATRPGTIGIALNDSPLGLASWMLEKLHEWSPTNDHALANDHDTVIDNVLPYWTTSCAASAAGLYRAEAAGPRPTQFEVVPVPTHFLRPHCDLVPAPPTSWMKRLHPELTVEDRKDGGHFAALEDPETFVDSVRAFAAGLR